MRTKGGLWRADSLPQMGHHFIRGWVDMAQGLVTILTLGYLTPGWALQFEMWLALRKNRKYRDTQKEEVGNDI